MRICKQCGKAGNASAFYISNKSRCKECVKANVRANYRENREHYRAYERARASLPHRVALREAYQKTEAYRESCRRTKPRWVAANPEKRAAHVVAGNAIRSGKLKRQPCEVCGAIKVHAHHDDYEKPLSVRWLCPFHHAEHHKASG